MNKAQTLPRYASHRLVVAGRVFPMPLLELDADGRVRLERFGEEVERTIFHSGAIRLKHRDIEAGIAATPEVVSLEEMQRILDSRDGWSISFE